MCPIFADEAGPLDPGPWRERLAADPNDNLARNDLAVALHLAGETAAALTVLAEGPAPGRGQSLCLINRFYLNEVQAARAELARLRGEDLRARAKKISPAARSGPPPQVSVIMPTYNRARQILPSVQSVLDQTLRDFELIAVNDGGDLAVAAALADLHSDRIVFVDAEHRGSYAAVNLGLALARGKYIARLDDDDLWKPDHLALTVAELEAHPESQVVYSDYELTEQERQGDEYVTVRTSAVACPEWDLQRFRRKMFFTIGNAVHRRSLLEIAGPYLEFPTRADWEFFLRLAGHTSFRRVPRVTFTYFLRNDRSNLTRSNPVRFNHYTNLIGYLHGLYALTSSLWLPAGRRDPRVTAVIAGLDSFLDRAPEAMRALKLRQLDFHSQKKLYTMFAQLAEDLEKSPETSPLARRAWAQAIAQGPLEVKNYFRYLRCLLRE